MNRRKLTIYCDNVRGRFRQKQHRCDVQEKSDASDATCDHARTAEMSASAAAPSHLVTLRRTRPLRLQYDEDKVIIKVIGTRISGKRWRTVSGADVEQTNVHSGVDSCSNSWTVAEDETTSPARQDSELSIRPVESSPGEDPREGRRDDGGVE